MASGSQGIHGLLRTPCSPGTAAGDPRKLDTLGLRGLVETLCDAVRTLHHRGIPHMSDILQDFPIAAPPDRVFDTISSPEGLDQWWTLRSNGTPEVGTSYELDFGPAYQWKAEVTK